MRTQRFDTIRRMADLARENEVDAVVVAGDVFDDNGEGIRLAIAHGGFIAFSERTETPNLIDVSWVLTTNSI